MCDVNKKRAIIFATHSIGGGVYIDLPPYLEELKKHTDCLIYVCDGEDSNTWSGLVKQYADVIISKKHGRYDFGSYQLGFWYLLEHPELYDSLEQIYFCNDSVIYNSSVRMDKFFKQGENKDFYGLTWFAYGFRKIENSDGTFDYPWDKHPHIQSYLFAVSKKIADDKRFRDFIDSIKAEVQKADIVANYEIGMSELIASMGYELESFYPRMGSCDPIGYFLLNKSSYKHPRIFVKRNPRTSPITLEEDIDFMP